MITCSAIEILVCRQRSAGSDVDAGARVSRQDHGQQT